jgi:hypothetical protein
MRKKILMILVYSFILYQSMNAAVIRVPDHYKSVQAAISAASANDMVKIASGTYRDSLTINKSITIIGTGPDSCMVFNESSKTPVVTISNADVTIHGLEISGGTHQSGFASGVSAEGITGSDVNLKLYDVVINRIANYMVRLEGGSLKASNVSLFTELYFFQCDVGFKLNGCIATFDSLFQQSGQIDHTIDINHVTGDPDSAFLFIRNSTIRASDLSWGDCIRIFGRARADIRNCSFYRESGGEPAEYDNHTGISINGPYIDLIVIGNVFHRLPWGISYFGSYTNSNWALVENNEFIESEIGGVLVQDMDYDGLDLGGGSFGSLGNNFFEQSVIYDVKLYRTPSYFFAKMNRWSDPDPDVVIWDNMDDSTLGRVYFFEDTPPPVPLLNYPENNAVDIPVETILRWNETYRVSGTYHLQLTEDPFFGNLIFNNASLTETYQEVGPLKSNTEYYWHVKGENNLGASPWSPVFNFTTLIPGSSIEIKNIDQEMKFSLQQAYPNPFNPETVIHFIVEKYEHVSLIIYDLLGQEVINLIDTKMAPGKYETVWNASHFTSGIYLCRMQAGDFVSTRKLILVK